MKNFHTKQRIDLGKDDRGQMHLRQRGAKIHKSVPKSVQASPYAKVWVARQKAKASAEKVNLYLDKNQPEFINSMSRTMDAYDTRIGTFGMQSGDKGEIHSKFIREKMGFIRSTPGYEGSNPVVMHNADVPERVLAPGPAFETSYDNRYQQRTVCANADGRVKISLQTNLHDSETLKKAERVRPSETPKKINIQLKTGEQGLSVSRDSREHIAIGENKILAQTSLRDSKTGSKMGSRPRTGFVYS